MRTVLFLALSLLPSLASGSVPSQAEVNRLVARIQRHHEQSLAKSAEASALLSYYISPDGPQQGDSVTIFAEVETDFSGNDTFLNGTLDGTAVTMQQPSRDLFLYNAGSYGVIGTHTFQGTIYIQNHADAVQLQGSITQLNTQITSLQAQIAAATDPTIIAALQAQLTQAQSEQAQLTASLANLKVLVGTQNFTFYVGANATSPSFPHISSISPNVALVNTAQQVTINGTGFGANPVVTLGGNAVTVAASSATSITGTVPAIATQGPQNLVVTFPNGGQATNAILNNAFFVTSTYVGNPPPISDASVAASQISLGATATFNSTGSTDPQGGTLSYHWNIVSIPAGSQLTIPSIGSSSTYSLTPDVPGTYVVELAVVSSVSGLTSAPDMAVVTALAPANRAPVLTGGSLSVATSATQTLQLGLTDPDFWQSHSYFITKQPSLGTASISSSGLLVYTAGTTPGSDSVTVMAVDNGTPPISASVTIPVTVNQNHSPIIPYPLDFLVFTRGLPYEVNVFTSPFATPAGGITSPNGPITSAVWNFGDGTEERTFDYSAANLIHNYLAAGTYTITLTVTDSTGASSSLSQAITIVDEPIPFGRFTVSPSNGGGTAPVTLTFDASTSTTPSGTASFAWFWGDGQVSFTTNPLSTHTYTAAGIYDVQLIVYDQNSSAGVSFTHVPAGVGLPEAQTTAGFDVGPPREVVLGTPLAFNAARSFDPNIGGSIASYSWNFGDYATCNGTGNTAGCSGTGLTASYTYPSPESYFATLSVVDNLGIPGSQTGQEVYVVNSGHAPHAVIYSNGTNGSSSSGSAGVAPFAVSFDGTGSYPYGAPIASYNWNFGNGATATGSTASYTFTTPGVYFVNLSVTDGSGNTETTTETITVTSSKEELAARVGSKPGKSAPLQDYRRKVFATACAKGNGQACDSLAAIFQKEGNSFAAAQMNARACKLGYKAACSK